MFEFRKSILGGAVFRQHEPTGAWDGAERMQDRLASGLAAGTRVATTMGWRPVEAVTEGDMVLTFDDGMQRVTRVERGLLWKDAAPLPRHLWPLEVPVGALGNQMPMLLLPEQSVMLESDSAEALFDDPFTLLPAAALEGLHGITRVAPAQPVEVITLHFERDQVVFANVGALFYCPAHAEGAIAPLWGQEGASAYRTLPIDEAEILIDCIASEAEEAALWAAKRQQGPRLA